MDLRDVLKGKLNEKDLALVPRSFDVIGTVAIMEIPDPILRHAKKIALALKETHPRVTAVCNKTGERSGDYRLPELKLIYGKITETEHLEYGCRFRVDPRKAYFSEREGTERQRIGKMIKPGENVLVMFSGVCPSPIIYARTQPGLEKVYGVDINPDAHRYALENIRINRMSSKVEAFCGDVRKVCPGLGLKFDRITMPLPKGAHEFLGLAVSLGNKNGIIHFYHVSREDDLYGDALKIIENECRKAERKFRVIAKNRTLTYGPRTWKICIDFRVS